MDPSECHPSFLQWINPLRQNSELERNLTHSCSSTSLVVAGGHDWVHALSDTQAVNSETPGRTTGYEASRRGPLPREARASAPGPADPASSVAAVEGTLLAPASSAGNNVCDRRVPGGVCIRFWGSLEQPEKALPLELSSEFTEAFGTTPGCSHHRGGAGFAAHGAARPTAATGAPREVTGMILPVTEGHPPASEWRVPGSWPGTEPSNLPSQSALAVYRRDPSGTRKGPPPPPQLCHSVPVDKERGGNSSAVAGDNTTLVPVSHYQIVLYRDHRIVVYDPVRRNVGARALSAAEESAISIYRMSRCPMCGQCIDPYRFAFEAQSYFRILQEILRSRTAYREADAFGWRHLLSCRVEEPSDGSDSKTYANPFVCPRADTEAKEGTGFNHDNGDVYPPKNLSAGMFNTGYYANFFRQIRELGSGSFGQVSLCHHYLDDVYLGEYAVKKVPVGDDKAWLQKTLREVKIREKLHHANIVEYKHSWLEMHRTNVRLPTIPWLFMLMEYCNGGDLELFMTQNGYLRGNITQGDLSSSERFVPMEETHIWKLFFDISNGLNHLHHSGILHRDLKHQNILLQCTLDRLSGQPTTTALLSDFGTSELLAESEVQAERHGFTGTIEFTAPELLETDAKGNFRNDYDEKSDIWSLGIILYAMAFGCVPYFNRDPQQCRLDILQHTDPQLLIPDSPKRSPDLVLLIDALLQRNPTARPSLDMILNHPRIRTRWSCPERMAMAGLEISYLLSVASGRTWKRSGSPAHEGRMETERVIRGRSASGVMMHPEGFLPLPRPFID